MKKIGIICDDFFYTNSLNNGIVELKYLSKDSEYDETLEAIIYVTLYNGIDNSWFLYKNQKIEAVKKLFKKYKTIPKFFINKEDPLADEESLEISKYCDFVYTTSEKMLKTYQNINNNRAELFYFFINNKIYNPINSAKYDLNSYIFSGTYYKNYKKRNLNMNLLFDNVINKGNKLKIYNRFSDYEKFNFPKKYDKYISTKVDYKKLQILEKKNEYIINLNTIENDTLIAQRIFNSLASGKSVISNYNYGISNKFPNVNIVYSKGELEKENTNEWISDRLYEINMFSVREILNNHTSKNFYLALNKKIGGEDLSVKEFIYVVCTSKKQFQEFVKIQNYKELKYAKEINEVPMESKYIEILDNQIYSPYLITDLYHAFEYCENIYFSTVGTKFCQHRYVNEYNKNATLFKRKSDFKKGYAIHQWGILKKEISLKKKISVIVPVYNNGDFLIGRAFKSLLKSKMFKNLEIIFFDDCSTDKETPIILNYLKLRYDNIKLLTSEGKASESASKGRNEGIKNATAKYIMFLDPDNYYFEGAIEELYETIEENKYDFVFGDMEIIDSNGVVKDYTYEAQNKNERKRDMLINRKFTSQSIQTAIYNREFLLKNKIKQIEGSVGQDTLFFQEVMIVSNNFKKINRMIHIYFSERKDSELNNIDVEYFRKLLIMKKKQIELFRKHMIMEEFIDISFDYEFQEYYLEKLMNIKEEEHVEATRIYKSILKLYYPFIGDKYKDYIFFEDFKRLFYNLEIKKLKQNCKDLEEVKNQKANRFIKLRERKNEYLYYEKELKWIYQNKLILLIKKFK